MCLFPKILISQVYSEDPDHIAPAGVVRSCIQHSSGISTRLGIFFVRVKV